MTGQGTTTQLVKVGASAPVLPMPAAAIALLQRTPNAGFARIVGRFLAWCADRKLELHTVTPGLAGDYLGQFEGSAPTKNQALAALRKFFDALVQRHAVMLNPFASVAGIKHSVTEGKTAELAIDQARKLFASIDVGNVVGLRDRAILGVLAYTGARVGAVSKCRFCVNRKCIENFEVKKRLAPQTGFGRWTLWFYKKGCQEKKLSRELEAAKSFDIQPPATVRILEA